MRLTTARGFDAALRNTHGVTALIGVDEAGRGPLAGPVVVAAVLLRREALKPLAGARDSKLLNAQRREFLYGLIRRHAAAISVSWAHPREIERDNILAATLSAMRRAAGRIKASDSLVIVDGNRRIPGLKSPQLTIVDGDNLSLSIACASIVAKVVRDRWMARLDRKYPGYGIARHKGYGTAMHMAALRKLGPSPIHRRTFAPVKELLGR